MKRERTELETMTIGDVLRKTAQECPNHNGVIFCQTNIHMTWEEFDSLVDQAAKGLLAIGFQRGDHLGIWATNCLEWVVLQFASARIGVVMVTINPGYRVDELVYVLKQSDVKGLAIIDQFKHSNYVQMMEEACPAVTSAAPGALNDPRYPKLRNVFLLRGVSHPGMTFWNDLLDAAQSVSSETLAEAILQVQPSDPVNLQYTSGTTGNPKGALLTHTNLILNAFFGGSYQKLDESDSICIPVPLYHCFGCVLGALCAVVSRAAMVFPYESFDAEATLNAIQSERCTSIYGVPTMFIAELEHASFSKVDTSSLRTGIMAGSPCPIELMKRVTSEMGASEITIGYGQTEASPLITMTLADDPLDLRVGTVGRALPDIEVKIIDPVTGQPLPDGQSGELCCRGHNIMLGYYNLPDKTKETIDEDGWLHTGDLSLRESNGYFRITGRLKDMIIRGGENIAPREIEELLYRHPHVEDVQVVGVPDRKLGEEILACIKLRGDEATDDEDIRSFCREKLAHFKVPRYVLFVGEFPTTVTGKIQKYRIREQAIKQLGLQFDADIETA